MISPDVRIEGWDQHSWTLLMGLFAPGVVDRMRTPEREEDDPTPEPAAGERPDGALVIVVDEHEEVLAAFHTSRGRADEVSDASDPETLAERFGARRVLILREGALEELVERLALRIRPEDGYGTQWLTLLKALRELTAAARIRIWPTPQKVVPIPSPATVRRALDLLLPDGRAIVFALWHAQELATAVVLRRREGLIDLVAGPDLLREWAGPLGGDFRRDYRVLVDAVTRSVAPVHLGLFAEAESLRRLLRRPDPGAWAAAAATRDLLIHPMPPYVAVALGADVANSAARGAAALLGGLDLFGAFRPVLGYVRSRVSEVSSLTATLGFNPLDALAQNLRQRDDRDTKD